MGILSHRRAYQSYLIVVTTVRFAAILTIGNLILPVFADTPHVNQDNNGKIVAGGNYYNTAGNRTTFRNTGAGGLWVRSDSNVRGLEVDANGTPTNNGGTLHFYAPGSVVRVDGKIDVSSLRNGQGVATGNGGRVYIDSDYLFQSGQILANGRNGGLVQVNVAGATLTPGAVIQARGEGGNGGVVAINATGIVDLQNHSLIDTSGRVSANFDTNIINIEGGLVNIEGIIKADGVESAFGGSRGGTIRLTAGSGVDVGTMRRAWGDETSALSATQREQLATRLNELHTGFRPVNHLRIYQVANTQAAITANGTLGNPEANNDPAQTGVPRAGDGGTIMLTSSQVIENVNGLIQANGGAGRSGAQPVRGGNGGTIVLLTNKEVINHPQGQIEANGGRGGSTVSPGAGATGGDGGVIVISAKDGFRNAGQVSVNGAKGGDGPTPGSGGQGGLMVLNMLSNPTQNGLLEANGAEGGNNGAAQFGGKSGTIVAWNPPTLQNTQRYSQRGYENGVLVQNNRTERSQTFELVTHAENAVLLVGDNRGQLFDYGIMQNLFGRISLARIRSVSDPTGTLGTARNEFISKNTLANPYQYRNLLSANNFPPGVTLNIEPPEAPDSFGLDGSSYFRKLNTLTILESSTIDTPLDFPAPPPVRPYEDFWVLGRDRSTFAGGRTTLLAADYIIFRTPFGATGGQASGGSVFIEAGSVYNNGSAYTRSAMHGGSVILKAYNPDDTRFEGTLFLGSQTNKPTYRNQTTADGGVLGGTIRLLSTSDIGHSLRNDITANGGLQGGIISIHAANNFYGLGDTKFQANGRFGDGGVIQIHAANNLVNSGLMEANGLHSGGKVILAAGDDVLETYFRRGLPNYLTRSQIPAFLINGSLTPPESQVTTGRYQDAEETLMNFGGIRAIGGDRNGKVLLGGNSQILLYEGSYLNNVRMNVSAVSAAANPNQAFQTSLGGLKANNGHVYAVTGQRVTGWLGNTRSAASTVLEASREGTAPDVNPNEPYQGSELPDDFSFTPAP